MFTTLSRQKNSQQVMSTKVLPQIDIVIPSDHELSLDFESWPSRTLDATELTPDQVAPERDSDKVVIKPTSDRLTTELATERDATEPTPVQLTTKPTPEHAHPFEHCGFSVKRSFSKRFQRILVTTRLKKRKTKVRLPIDQSDEDQRQTEEAADPDETPKISGLRGRSITSKMPSDLRRSLHDDGHGCWKDEFGYIYRSGIDMSISRQSLSGEGSGEGRAPRASDEADGRVDSRVPRGSLGNVADLSEKQGLRDDGAPGRAPRVSEDEYRQAVLEDQRVFELEAIEAVLGSHDVSGDGVVDIGADGSNDAESSCCDAGGCCSVAGDE